MKIAVTLIIDVAAHEWAELNGPPGDIDGNVSFEDVERDVRSYYLNIAQCAEMTTATRASVNILDGKE